MAVREIIEIDADKCDGCGLCILACAEGAIQLVNGKAVLVSDRYCDGLGACLGDCPQHAITIVKREALDFDEKAVENHRRSEPPHQPVESRLSPQNGSYNAPRKPVRPLAGFPTPGGCPGSRPQAFGSGESIPLGKTGSSSLSLPQLTNWPVQLMLAPIKAPYFDGAELLIAADCVPFACPDFHSDFLAGRILLIACPKLDRVEIYREKLHDVFSQNDIKSIDIAFMEVPCCNGLVQLVTTAVQETGKNIPINLTKLGIRGQVLATGKTSRKEDAA
nr:4Fe-4S binding protein [candidate division Zixibacteria bacterium]